jgi:hypothetical protein
MGRDLDALNETLHKEGWFHGLNKIYKEDKINGKEYSKLKSYMFGLLSKKLNEAKTELERLEAVFKRLDAVCQMGSAPKPFHGVTAPDADVERLRQELKALHGWTLSLAETDFYLHFTAESPATAEQKFSGLDVHLRTLTRVQRNTGLKNLGGLFLERNL